ncbi:TPA: hypothetical protein QDB04_002302 [Burkholderia vietnamiensis]|nr:hypothetical protein [Burkholderia vietnamiensis]
MKLVVVTGLIYPNDPTQKRRPAVVLGMVNGRVAVAPCSTNIERTGEVKVGSVLITKESPAFEGTNFRAEKVIIRIKDTALYSIDSHFVKNCKQIGVLDTDLDKHVRDNLRDLMRTYDLIHCNKQYN